MESNTAIKINTFRRLRFSVGDKSINEGINNSKKTWAFLAYTMIYRNKFITQNDIIEALWVNEIGSPYNSLKTFGISF